MDKISVRYFRLTDLLLLRRWISQSKGSFGKSFIQELRYAVVHFFRAKYGRGRIFTALIDGQPVGVINVRMDVWKREGGQTMFDIVVSSDHRGKGIGSFLISHAEKYAKRVLRASLMCLDVFEGNPAARLYERLGYQEGGFIPNYLKDGRGKTTMYKHL